MGRHADFELRDFFGFGITEKGGGRFPQMFGEEFVNAYERQVAEYRRHDREGTVEKERPVASAALDPGLLATQKLDGPVIAESVGADQPFNDDSIVDRRQLHRR